MYLLNIGLRERHNSVIDVYHLSGIATKIKKH